MEGSRALQPLGKAGVHRRLRGAARKHTRGESTRGGGRHGRLLVMGGAQPPRRDPLSQLLRGEADALRNLRRSTQAEGRERVERVCA